MPYLYVIIIKQIKNINLTLLKMKQFEEIKEFAIKIAKEKGACNYQLKNVEKSQTLDELMVVIRDNAGWIKRNDALNDEKSIELFGLSLSNLFNSGNWNSGDMNSGERNSGDRNSGNWNSGDMNSGERNSGDRNSGNWNSGDRNSGDMNSGNWNSGERNSGNWNTGDRNSGNWNTGDLNVGFFNSKTPYTINAFNKPCLKIDWDNAIKPYFIFNIRQTEWISFSEMTDEEKIYNPKASVSNGYLKTITLKDSWKIAFEKASENDINLLKALPNFDSEVFFEITGILIK